MVVDTGLASRVTQSMGIHTADMNQQAAQNRDASAWGEPLHALAAEEAQAQALALGMGGTPDELRGGVWGGGGGGSGGSGSGPSAGFVSELGRVMVERVAMFAEREEVRRTMLPMRDLLQNLQAETDRLNHQNNEMTRMIRNHLASVVLGASMLGRLLQEYRPVLHHQQRDMDNMQSEVRDVFESLYADLPQETRPELREFRGGPQSQVRDFLSQPTPAEYGNQGFPTQFHRLQEALRTHAQGESEDTLAGISRAVQRLVVGGARDREAAEANGFSRSGFQSLVVHLGEEVGEHNNGEALRSVRDSLVRLGEITGELDESLSAGDTLATSRWATTAMALSPSASQQAPTQTPSGGERMGLPVAIEQHIQIASKSLHLAARAA